MASYAKGNLTVNYEYNEYGLRTQKVVNNNGTVTTYNYIWSDDKLTHQTWGNCYMHFYYDYSDEIVGFEYFDGTTLSYYAYIKNMQGDVISIIDSSGNRIADYSYDAWGKLKSATSGIGLINPIRYRGYYYDTEISMYYLQSRYYDPAVGRFINADDTDYIGYTETMLSYNIFSYCENNPIMRIDPNGYWNLTNTLGSGSHADLIKSSSLYKADHNKNKLNTKSNIFGEMVKSDTNYRKNAQKLWKIVIEWDEKADREFPSNDFLTSPFHNKEKALIIVDELLNYAIWFKNRAEANKPNTELVFSKKTNKKTQAGLSESFLFVWKPNYRIEKLNMYRLYQIGLYRLTGGLTPSEYNGKLLKMLNKLNNKEKSVAFLGLALHTLQDYFAHRVIVEYSKGGTKDSDTSHIVFKDKINYYEGEDLAYALEYRYEDAKMHTEDLLIDYWCDNYHKVYTIKGKAASNSVKWQNQSFCTYNKNGYKLVYYRQNIINKYLNKWEPSF